MADQANAEAGSGRRQPRVLLEGLADIKIGQRMAINLRVFFEPIGLLKFVLIFTSMFALALTAGYSSNGSNNRATCQGNGTDSDTTYTVSMSFSYPYHTTSYKFNYNPPSNISDTGNCQLNDNRGDYVGMSEFFVAMSSFTFVFAILSFPVYFLFYVPRYDLSKYLSVIDLIITCLLVFFYFFAVIVWPAGISSLNSSHRDLLNEKRRLCYGFVCNLNNLPSPSIQNSVQLGFSALFGWVSFMLLAASIWFIYKETIVHIERMGPLYKISFFGRKASKETYQPEPGTYTPKTNNPAPVPDKQEKLTSIEIGDPPETRKDETEDY